MLPVGQRQTSNDPYLGKLTLLPTTPLYHCRDFHYYPGHKKSGFHSLQEFNDCVTFDDGLPMSATKVQKIISLSEPMNSDSDAEIDNESLIQLLYFLMRCLETEKIPHAEGCN
ncbi:hypothetical protein TNCV_3733611 [Trichonephila clavipes]|nr:hypothetical protein TNCV_3733611 [Trichonephila clavipes]